MKTKPPQIPVFDPSTRDKGDNAENIVRAYLENKGYEIFDTNWYYGKYELDIIARDGEELVIVEVRSRVGEGFEHPEDAISEQKIKHIITAAEGWIQKHRWEKNTRFDLITVAIMGPDKYELNHYDYAFYPKP